LGKKQYGAGASYKSTGAGWEQARFLTLLAGVRIWKLWVATRLVAKPILIFLRKMWSHLLVLFISSTPQRH